MPTRGGSVDPSVLLDQQPEAVDAMLQTVADMRDWWSTEEMRRLRLAQDGSRPAVDAEAGRAAVEAAERVVASLREHEIEGRRVESRGKWG